MKTGAPEGAAQDRLVTTRTERLLKKSISMEAHEAQGEKEVQDLLWQPF